MKKAILSLLVLMLVFGTLPGISETYTATEKGYGGEVTVTLEIVDEKLVSVKAEGPSETFGIGSRALEEMPAAMLETNSIDVDITSGASFTGNAIAKAAKKALESSGAVLVPVETKKETVSYSDEEIDLVIVGGGIAGISAAIEAANSGVHAILIEKTGALGGAANVAAGAVWAIDSKAALEHYDFTADEIYEFFSKKSGPVENKELFYNLANESTASYQFMMDNGVEFPQAFQCNPQADPRFWGMFSANRGGGLMTALIGSLNTKDTDVRMNHTAEGIVTDEQGNVTGVNASWEGGTYTITAKSIILATGGFGHDPELFAKYVPGYDRININNTYPGATGDGHRFAEALGDELISWGSMGSVGVPTLTAAVVLNPATDGQPLVMDINGNQICASNEHYTKIYTLCLDAPDGVVYTVYPSDINNYTEFTTARMDAMVEDGGGWKADTLEELADLSGINKENFLNSIAQHNQQIKDGATDAFNTPIEVMIPIENGPFYLIKRVPACIGTITAPVVDQDMHIMANGKPIENLYAVGELIYSNWFNQGYPMSGTGLGGCVSSGRLAVQHILGK